ncbi:MAG: PAS domain S-box protein [Candidatus Saccharicenans sp.]|nr:PAS domain S-box protein [Candidatus Saccharicenans sp.]MDI6849727.1 PAS domain S-box protein [Candidatus Saccharicenans sp.]
MPLKKSQAVKSINKDKSRVKFNADTVCLLRQLQEAADRENHLEKFLEETSRILSQAFKHGRVTIFLYDEETRELFFLRGWITDKGEFPEGYRQKINLGLMGKVVRSRRPLIVNDISEDKDFLSVPGLRAGSEACFPIIFKGQILGVLDIIDERKKAFEPGEIDFLNFLTRFLGSALAERQKARALTTQAEKTTLILDGIRDGYYEVDLKGRFIFMNEALAAAWGRSRQEMLGKSYRDFLEADSIDRVFSIFNEVFKTGRARLGLEAQVRDVRGERHIVEFSVSLLKNEAGEPSGFYGIVHDITDRVRIEQELRAANARFESLLEALPDVIYFKDLEGRNLIVNRAMEDLTGLSRDKIIGKKDEEIFSPELALQCKQSDFEVLEKKKPLKFYESLIDKNGRERYFESIKSPVFDQADNLIGIVGISRNITELKQAEDRLKESERSFRSVFENSTLGLYRTTPDGRILLANPTLIRMLGYESFEELANRNLEIDGFEPGYPRKMFLERIKREGEIRGLEAAWRKKDGSFIYVRESARAIKDETGKILYFEGTVEDITERKEAELKLAAQQELFQTVLDSAEDIILILDKDYRILLFNRVAERYFGVSPGEVTGRSMADFYPADGWPAARERFDKVFRGETIREDVHLDFRGRKMILSVTEVPLRNEAGEVYGLCGIAREISHRVQLERELESSLREKEALLREIHHRVKNNMQIISSLLNLQAYHVQNPELTVILKDCQNRIRSMAMIHEHLYKSTNLARIDFANYLNRLLLHLYNVHRQSLEKIELETELQPVEMDIGTAIPLGLLASELISNSFKHAFPGGRTGRVRIILHSIPAAGFKLEISDNGIGLPDDFSFEQTRTFGMQLVVLLKDQLGARLEVDRKSGTRFIISTA